MQVELKHLQKKLGITFIYVTHDQDEALSMSDRIVVLRNGKIEQIDSPTDIYDRPNSLYVAEFIGDANVIHSKVESIDEDKKLINLEDNMVGKLNGEFKVGDKVDIVIRPENIKVSGTLKNKNSFTGIVKELIYDGSSTKLIFKIDGEMIKVVVFGNDKKYEVGQELNLYWDIEDIVIFGRDKNEE